jgi:hypothetical protein
MRSERIIRRCGVLAALCAANLLVAVTPLVAVASARYGQRVATGSVAGQGGARLRDSLQADGHAFAMLEDCTTPHAQNVAAATFAARMTVLPGAAEMELRFEILERKPGQSSFHRAASIGDSAVGAWRISGEHVTVFKDFDEVKGLEGPAAYRAKVHFRWLDSEGQAVDWSAHRTAPCRQPAPLGPSGS